MKNNRKSTDSFGGIPVQLMTVLMIRTMLSDIAANMVQALQQILGQTGMETEPITEDYANRLGAALYFVAISIPFEVLRDQLGGPINAAWNFMHQKSDVCSPANVTQLVRGGFQDLSPTMSAAITEDIITKVGKLMLWDWLVMNTEPTSVEMFEYDRMFYFHELVQLETNPDNEAIRVEGYKHLMSLSPAERADINPELFAAAEQWAKEEGIQKDE